MRQLFNAKGFSLIELLVVISVLGILSSMVYVAINPQGQFNKANDGKRKSDLAAIQSALEQWRFDNSTYPPEASFSGCGSGASLESDGITYLQAIPCDPDGVTYDYGLDATTGNYCIRACLKNSSDKMRDSVVYGSENANTCGSMSNCPIGPIATYSYTVVNQ